MKMARQSGPFIRGCLHDLERMIHAIEDDCDGVVHSTVVGKDGYVLSRSKGPITGRIDPQSGIIASVYDLYVIAPLGARN
jgi:hypothetical protein